MEELWQLRTNHRAHTGADCVRHRRQEVSETASGMWTRNPFRSFIILTFFPSDLSMRFAAIFDRGMVFPSSQPSELDPLPRFHQDSWEPQPMMSMGFMHDSLNGSDSTKSAFLEFGHPVHHHHHHHHHQQQQPQQQHLYPVQGLHPAGPPQHDGPFPGAASYSRSLGYSYPGSVSAHPGTAYMSYGGHSTSSSLGPHSRLEPAGMWGNNTFCIIYYCGILRPCAQLRTKRL